MKKILSIALLLLILVGASASIVFAQDTFPTDDDVNKIARQLYCPVCESTPLDVCPTEACRQWRDVIRTMLMAIGILGIELFQTETQGTVSAGNSIDIAGYTVQYKEVASWDDIPKGVNYTRAVVDIYENGVYLGELHPRKDYYFDSQQNMTIPGNRSTLKDDLYILLVDWQPISSAGATFKIYVNPLVNWLWLGSLLFIVGIIIAAWPDKDPERVVVHADRHLKQTSAAD